MTALSNRVVAAPTGLMVGLLAHPEHASGPLPTDRPRFTWIPATNQVAYQIRVWAAGQKSTPVWDSGRIADAANVGVAYGGTSPLASGDWEWEVRTWQANSRDGSAWSGRQRFRTGKWEDPVEGIHADPDIRTTTARYKMEQSEVHPVRLLHPEAGRAFLDFGKAAFAGLTLNLTATQDGERVTVILGEAADGNRVRRKPGGSVRCLVTEMVLKAGTHTYTVPLLPNDARRMPPNIGPVMPFRYVEVEGLHGPLSATDAVQKVARYPFDLNAARFRSSDPVLNRVWEISHYTMAATTFCGVYVDGDRERLPYEADAYINQLGHYCCDREFTLARYSNEHLIQRPTWPTEWFLFSVLCAWEDYRHSGDPDSLRAFYADLEAKTLHALARPDGLISTIEPPVPAEVARSVQHSPKVRKVEDIVDWPPAERDGYEMRPVNTVVNAFYCYALACMARIAEAVEKPAEARTWREQAARATATLNEKLFDKTSGLYVDGEGSTHSSLHANMFPLAFDLVPSERVAGVADFLVKRGMACSVYGAQFLLDALYSAGRGDAALALLTAKGDRGWLHMSETLGSTMTLEAWDPKYKANLDWNHAWGAAPANLIPRRLMGIEPAEPGFRRARIQPQPGSLTRAEAVLPTVRGPIRAAFDASDPTRFRLEITLPPNLPADVSLPSLAGSNAKDKVLVDGRPVTASPISLPGGKTYRLERRRGS